MGRSDARCLRRWGAWRSVSLLAVLGAASLPFGCAAISEVMTPRAYDGPGLPKDKVAVITIADPETNDFVTIAKIDGAGCYSQFFALRAKNCGGYAEVLPGRHDVDLERHVWIGSIVGAMPATAASKLPLVAEAGHVYLARSNRIAGKTWFWIEDTTTGEVVAGDRPPAGN